MNKLNYLLLSIFSINITFGTSLVTFDIDGVEECGFISVTGTWDSWSGWGATTDTDMQADIDTGEHEFIILCVDTEIPDWWNNIWTASTIFNAPVDTDCWNENYEYPNYIFNVDDSGDDLTVAYCAGTCDATCEEIVDPCDDIDCGDLTCIDGECVETSMVNVTFQVDMANVATDAEGVYLVGSDPLLEGPTGLLMNDEDGDDIWSLEVLLETGVYTYKFRNGFCDDWDNCDASWENTLEECGVGEWDDREVVVGDVDLDVGPFCFNSCDVGYCPDDIEFYPITFIVDMNYQDTDPSGAYVTGGNVYMEGPIGHLMDDSDGDDIWEVTVDLPPGTYTFKFRNGFCGTWNSCWQWQWEDFEGECGVGEWGDREITVVDEGFTYGSYCFDFCEEGGCPNIVPIDVTFQVEVDVDQMSDAMGYGVFMYGNFNGYDYLFNPLPLEYTGSNYTFSVTTTFTANDYILYKYSIGSGGDANTETDEGIAGCGSNFSGDCGGGGSNYREQVIPYFSETFELDTFDDCPGNAIVTLSVDMSNELISGNGICIAGGTMPNGPEGTSMCDLNNDDIYSVSLSFPYDSHQTYKFINGCGDSWENPGFETIDGDCVEGEWGDRFFDVLEDGQNVGPYFFGSCELSDPLNFTELPIPNEYALYPAYPNPFNPMTTITYSIPDPSIVTIRVYDILGNQVTELLDQFMSAGNHQVIWNANKQPTGIYFVRLSTEKLSQTQKIILAK